jgi:LysM repeat protein
MAAKKPAKPRKFKQARKDAKSAAKQTFSGKSQARLKDPLTKLTADDKAALSEMKTTAKAELGKDAYLSKKDYEATQKAAREKFRSEMRAEFGEYGGKKAGATDTQAPKRTPKAKTVTKPTVSENAKRLSKTRTFTTAVETPSQTEKKPRVAKQQDPKKVSTSKASGKKKPATKPAVNKPAAKGYSAGKTLNSIGQGRYDALIKEGVAPKKAMNKALFFQEKGVKAQAKAGMDKAAKNIGGMTDRQEAALQRKVGKTERKAAKLRAADPAKYDAREKAATNPKLSSEQKVKEIRKIGSTTKPKPAEAPKPNKYLNMQNAKKSAKTPKYVVSTRTNAPKEVAAKPVNSIAAKAKRFGKTKAAGKGLIAGALIAEAGSALKGSTEKDFREIQRLENRLAKMQGKAPKYKNMGSNKNIIESSKADLSNLANLATMGLVGKTRRGRMDELNAKIAKAETKRATRINAGRAAKAAAGKKTLGGANRSSTPMNKTFKVATGAGGSTSATPIKGSSYRVAKGDTLSGISKRAGVTLSEVLAANPTIADKKSKYKGGSMIWANTKVNIPTSKKK